MASEFAEGKQVRCKMDRRDIAMLILAVLVVVEGACVVYLIADTRTDIEDIRNKLHNQGNTLQNQGNKLDNQQDTLTSMYDEQQKDQASNKGVVYVRWGREDCPGSTTELVYSEGKVDHCKMDRRDIAMLFLAVLVVVEGAGVVYLIATVTQSDLAVIRYKMEKQQETIEKQQEAVKNISTDTSAVIEEIRNNQQKEALNTTSAIDEIRSTLQSQQETITSIMVTAQDQKLLTSQGVVYIRWGRKECAGNMTELVYSGYAGGSHYNSPGGAAEYVCLPPDPTWGPKKDGLSYAPDLMYGAEYQGNEHFNVPDLNREVPCAVCRISEQSTSIMIPARTTCYPGWTEAYHGYLASGYHDHTGASEFVCVDEYPETLDGGGHTNDDGKLFCQVRTRCGSLKCPPYENDKVLSCVVCMK